MIDQKRRERINIWWVIGSGVMGAVLLAAALLAEHLSVLTTVSLEILVSTGAAVLLAGFLFFLQRHFVSEVEHVVTRAAESAAETLVDERMRQVGARIDELGKRLDEAVAARSERQDAAVEAMGTPTFVTVANALAEANNLAAVGNGVIRVQGSRQRGELALDFSWGVAMGDGRFGEPERTELSVSAHVYADDRTTGGRPVIETIWAADDTAEAVGLRLREQLERSGRWRGDGTLDWPRALKNLQRSLDLAMRSRRRDGTGWILEGALFELVGDEWAITTAGLECPPRGYILRDSEFPDSVFPRSQQDPPPPWRPARPDWVEPELWQELLAQGRSRFPIRRGPMLSAPSWMPLRQGPETGSVGS